MTAGEKIAKLRKENNFTQEQFAEILNVSRQAVSKWELNVSYPETEKLIRISKMFHCSIDYLLQDEINNMDMSNRNPKDEDRKNYIMGMLLTYFSFPPLFGFFVGIFSLQHQKKKMYNKTMTNLTITGMCISLALTILMICGIVFQL